MLLMFVEWVAGPLYVCGMDWRVTLTSVCGMDGRATRVFVIIGWEEGHLLLCEFHPFLLCFYNCWGL